jgi:hypothetical protein
MEPEISMTSAKVSSLIDSAADVLEQLQRAANAGAKDSKRRAGLVLDQSGELLGTVSAGTSEAVAHLANSLVAFTKKKPLVALLLAVGAGALLVSAAKSAPSRRR